MNSEITPASLPPCRTVRKKAGQYRLTGEIGDGGMATVYVGHQISRSGLKRAVAVKILHEHLSRDREVTRRFLDEMRLVSLIDHPFVCKIFDHGETTDGRPYFAMEYLMGEPLWRVLRAMVRGRGKLETQERVAFVVRVIAGLAEGLHAAHEARDDQGTALNVIHRDISPQNLFVLYDGTVRLVDFGVARHETTTRHTKTGAIMGKLPYLAPEQIHGEAYDRRLDIWALGVVLWELLACRRLFRRAKEMPTLRAVCYDPVPRLSDMGVGDEELDAIVLRTLERNVQRRTRTARELATALERWLARKNLSMTAADVSDHMHLLFPGSRVERERWARSSPEIGIDDLSDQATTAPSLHWRKMVSREAELWRESHTDTDTAVDRERATATYTITSDDLIDEVTSVLPVDVDMSSLFTNTKTPKPDDVPSITSPSVCRPEQGLLALATSTAVPPAPVFALALAPAAKPKRRVRPNLRAIGSLGLAFALAAFAVLFGAHALRPPATLTTAPVRAASRLVELPASKASPSTLHDAEVTLVSAAEPSPLDKAPEPAADDAPEPAPALKQVITSATPPKAVAAVEPAAAPSPNPAAGEFGEVYVTTSGGKATVFERGRVLGTTPLRVRLAAGTHVLDLAPIGGGTGMSVTTTVTSGGTALVSARLASNPVHNVSTDSRVSAAH